VDPQRLDLGPALDAEVDEEVVPFQPLLAAALTPDDVTARRGDDGGDGDGAGDDQGRLAAGMNQRGGAPSRSA